MPGLLIGIAAALAAAGLYAAGIVLQALEARATPERHALRLSLLRLLVRRRRWLVGTAVGLAGWILQALALTQAPLTLVQPLLGAGLVFVLVASVRLLGEHVHRAEIAAVFAIAAGMPLLALTAPAREARHAGGVRLAVALGVLGTLALAPLALRGAARATSVLVPVGAGLAYSLDGLATKFASDDYVHAAWLGCAVWFVAMSLASGLGTLSEMSALQRRPVAQVAPIVFALNTFVPVGLAPLLAREWWPASAPRDAGIVVALGLVGAGAVVLARSEPVARALAATGSSSPSGTARSPLEERAAASPASDLRV